MMNSTTITISKKTKSRLKKFKSHPRQSYEEFFQDVIKMLEEKKK